MNQAERMLNENEYYVKSAGSGESEPHIIVGNNRDILVPEELKEIAVQFDHNIETVTFDCPRYWDGHDMSKMVVYINYKCPDGVLGCYAATNVRVDELNTDIMHFDWTLLRNATTVKGTLIFLVCIKKVDADGNETNHWNSNLCSDMYISEGLECTPSIIDNYPDVITQLLTSVEAISGKDISKVELLVSDTADSNKTLTVRITTSGGTVINSNSIELSSGNKKSEINDNVTAANSTWSSSKISGELARPEHKTMVVTISKEGITYKSDHTSAQIIDHARTGVVIAKYVDDASGETRTYQYTKQTSDNRAVFSKDGYIENDASKQTLIYVDYAGNITVETKTVPKDGIQSVTNSISGDSLTTTVTGADGQQKSSNPVTLPKYTLTAANSSNLGGFKADAKTEADNIPVKIGPDGKGYVAGSNIVNGVVYVELVALKTATIQQHQGEKITISFEDGMTWEQWVSSKYNTFGYVVNNNNTDIIRDKKITDEYGSNTFKKISAITVNDKIIENKDYTESICFDIHEKPQS